MSLPKEQYLFMAAPVHKIGDIVKIRQNYFRVTSLERGQSNGIMFHYYGIPHNPTPAEKFQLRTRQIQTVK